MSRAARRGPPREGAPTVTGNDQSEPALRKMRACRRCLSLRSQEGFSYIGILLMVALIGTQLALAGVVWSFAQARQKERELLFVGGQFRTAISQYYLNPKGPQKEYPRRLEDLIKDPRYPATIRHLRKIYADPITGKKQWGLIKLPNNGGIVGVYSLSEKEPIKTDNFRPADKSFARKQRYSEWKFAALGTVNVGAPGSPGTAAVPGAPASGLSSDIPIHNGEDEEK